MPQHVGQTNEAQLAEQSPMEARRIPRFQLTIDERDRYLLARVTGTWTPDAFNRALDEVAAQSLALGHELLLLDLGELKPPDWLFQRSLGGRHAAKVLKGLKVGVVVPALGVNGIAASAASRGGLWLLTDSSRERVLVWLLGDSPSTSGKPRG